MPLLCKLGDVCGVTEAREEHATSLVHAYFELKGVERRLDSLESENLRTYGIPRGVQGPGGNFSNSLRSVVRAQTASLRRQISNLNKLGVPASVIKKMTIKPRLTLMNE